ncbi:MAG: hypothetical protein JSV82_06740 [Planctomycetota bacterium]|nr:MAG: hypothetical protein JSV82_06740 [Planctomycetota bacterium]
MKTWYIVICLVLASIVGCEAIENAFEDEKEIPLSEVPKEVVVAAELAVEGITLTEAEVEKEGGLMVYELEGIANGMEYEIEVTADGRVLEVEQEEDDE